MLQPIAERQNGVPLMSTDVAAEPTEQELVELLDPERDYGERKYIEVVRGIREGTILIRRGYNLPMLWEAATHHAIKGSGRPADGLSSQQLALREFRARGIDDLPEVYGATLKGIRAGDARWGKIWWEIMVGKMGENRGGEAMAEAFKALIAAMQQPEQRMAREVVIDAE